MDMPVGKASPAFPTPVGMNRVTLELDKTKKAFPTPVGMNRFDPRVGMLDMRVPHTRGDEPVLLGYRTL